MNFKGHAAADLAAFFSLDEFAGEHVLDGQTVRAVVDADLSMERQVRRGVDRLDGVFREERVVFVRAEDVARPVHGQGMVLDGSYYTVEHVAESEGVLELTLVANAQ